MGIEEFINSYTANEVEKVERKDVLKRFQTKLQIQKIGAYKSVE